jgi:hypothetical protein
LKYCTKKLGKNYIRPAVNAKGQQVLPPPNSNMNGGKALIVDFISSKSATVEYTLTFPKAGMWTLYSRVSTYESHYSPKDYKSKACNSYGNEDSLFVPGACQHCRSNAAGKKDNKVNLGSKKHRKSFCTNDFKSKGNFKCLGGPCRKARGSDIRNGVFTFRKNDKNLVKRYGSLAKDKKGKALKKEKDVQKAFFKHRTCRISSPFDKEIDMELHSGSSWHMGRVGGKWAKAEIFAEGNYGWFRMSTSGLGAGHPSAYRVTGKQAGKVGTFTIKARERGFSLDRFVFVRNVGKNPPTDAQLDSLPNTALLFASSWDAAKAKRGGLRGVRAPPLDTKHKGHFGSGFVDYTTARDQTITFSVTPGAPGTYALSVGYALSSGDRPLELQVNGKVVKVPRQKPYANDGRLHFPRSRGWTDWKSTKPVNIVLKGGVNSIRLRTVGRSGANIDGIHIEALKNPAANCAKATAGCPAYCVKHTKSKSGKYVTPVVTQTGYGKNGATFQLSVDLKGQAASLYSIHGTDLGPLSMPPAYQSSKSPLVGAPNPLYRQGDDSFLSIGLPYVDKKQIAASPNFPAWTASKGLSSKNAAIFWMDPRKAPSHGKSILVAQVTVKVPCGKKWSAEMGMTGYTLNGKAWRDDGVVFAWSKFSMPKPGCPVYIPPAVRSRNGKFANPIVTQTAYGTNGATFQLAVKLKGQAANLYSIHGTDRGPLSMPPAYQSSKSPAIGAPNPIFNQGDDSFLTVGLSFVNKKQIAATSIPTWTANLGLRTSNSALFWMNPRSGPKAGKPIVVAQVTVKVPCSKLWSAQMGASGFKRNGQVWRDDKIVFAWSKFKVKTSGKKCPADVEYKKGPGVVNVEDLLVILSAFGSKCPSQVSCEVDIETKRSPGEITVEDLLAVLSAFGMPCGN